MSRYPFAPLAALMGCTEASAARRLNISGKTEQQYRREGLSAKVADRMAVRAGFHPYEVWPEMAERDYIDYKDANRAKATERMRRYRKKPEARSKKKAVNRAYYEQCREALLAAERRRYWADPERQRERKRQERARRRALVVGPLAHDRPMEDEEAA